MSLAARWMLATMCVPLAGCALTSLRTAEQPTTGDKLRAIHAAAHGDGAWIQPGFTEQEVILRLANAPRWCADLRKQSAAVHKLQVRAHNYRTHTHRHTTATATTTLTARKRTARGGHGRAAEGREESRQGVTS